MAYKSDGRRRTRSKWIIQLLWNSRKAIPAHYTGISCWKNYHGVDMVSDHEKEEAKQMSQVLLTLESAAVL
jgi:hypothetical protein